MLRRQQFARFLEAPAMRPSHVDHLILEPERRFDDAASKFQVPSGFGYIGTFARLSLPGNGHGRLRCKWHTLVVLPSLFLTVRQPGIGG
jgi:hypothetical protein